MVQFDPPLSTAVTVAVPPTLLPGSRLRLHATLSRDEHASLRRDGTKVQVWSDFGTGEWSETSFVDEEPVALERQDSTPVAVDLSLGGPDGEEAASSSGDTVTLVATAPLQPLVGRTVQFTYRMIHASGAVSWLGSMGTNGSISVEQTPAPGIRAAAWRESANGMFSWNVSAGSGPVVIAKLGRDADWRGWAIGKEGPSSFTAVSSAVAGRVALALLPKARPGAYVTYEPVLYHTARDATLSLTDNGEIIVHAGDSDSAMYVSTATESWMNAISDKATTLDVYSPHFLGVSTVQTAIVRCIHILPLSGSKAFVTLTAADLESLASLSDTIALVDSVSHAAKFFTLPLSDAIRVAVGPEGGEVLVLPAYILHDDDDECRVACFPREAGGVISVAVPTKHAAHSDETPSSTEYATSESAATEEFSDSKADVDEPSERQHPPSALESGVLLLMLHVLRLLLGLISASTSTASPPQISQGSVDGGSGVLVEQQVTQSEAVSKPRATRRIAFEVTGRFIVVVKGDVTKLALSVDGKALHSIPNAIGGVLLLEGDAGSDPQLLEVALHE